MAVESEALLSKYKVDGPRKVHYVLALAERGVMSSDFLCQASDYHNKLGWLDRLREHAFDSLLTARAAGLASERKQLTPRRERLLRFVGCERVLAL